MSFFASFFRLVFGVGDAMRDFRYREPSDILRIVQADYVGDADPFHRLELYLPTEKETKMPLIISVHGGGWVYGTLNNYRPFCMALAQKGFAVANFNYRLAPEHHFPAQLEDTLAALAWLQAKSDEYALDMARVALVGDSAGAHLACVLATMLANSAYANMLGFTTPTQPIKALGLACPILDPLELIARPTTPGIKRWYLSGLMKDLLGEDYMANRRKLAFWEHIETGFPPAHISVHQNDLLVGAPCPLNGRLTQAHGKFTVFNSANPFEGHVFHLNVRSSSGQRYIQELSAFISNLLGSTDL